MRLILNSIINIANYRFLLHVYGLQWFFVSKVYSRLSDPWIIICCYLDCHAFISKTLLLCTCYDLLVVLNVGIFWEYLRTTFTYMYIRNALDVSLLFFVFSIFCHRFLAEFVHFWFSIIALFPLRLILVMNMYSDWISINTETECWFCANCALVADYSSVAYVAVE